MANTTTNYKLNKPLQEENVNIDVLNQNMDIIDTNLKSLSDEINEVKSDIPSTDGLVTTTSLNTTLSSYAKKTDLPDEYDDTELSSRITNVENALGDKANTSAIPTKVSQLTNDKGYLTSSDVDMSQNHVHTNKTILDKLTQEYIDKIDGIAEGAEQNVQADWNAVSGDSFIKNKPEFAEVATSGSYNDLVDKPTIPTKTSQLTNDSGFKTMDTNTTYSLSKSGSTITLTGSDGSTTSVSDSDTDTVYTHPTTAGNKHIPSGGSAGQILEWSASGTAKWVTPNFSSGGGSGTIYYQTTQPTDAVKNSVWIR